jgi:hypothetical protein
MKHSVHILDSSPRFLHKEIEFDHAKQCLDFVRCLPSHSIAIVKWGEGRAKVEVVDRKIILEEILEVF